jgi:hypothetical protein
MSRFSLKMARQAFSEPSLCVLGAQFKVGADIGLHPRLRHGVVLLYSKPYPSIRWDHYDAVGHRRGWKGNAAADKTASAPSPAGSQPGD